MQNKKVVKLELLEVERTPPANGVEGVRLQTNDGVIPCRYHAAANGDSVLWVYGSRGGVDGPAGGLYERLSEQLASSNVAALRLDYRHPGALIPCVLDVLLGIGFLRNEGHKRVALVGHAFGGAVVINAGVASPAVIAVAALSSQMMGADDIAELSPRPVLLIHGAADEVRSEIGARNLYDLAADPKELIVYPGCGHELEECRDALDRDLLKWLRQVAFA